MKIGELARKAGVTTSRIRFYEARGLLAKAVREANGYRTYSPFDAKIIRFIERAQRLGFSLKDIAAFLANLGRERSVPAALITRLENKLQEIDSHLAEVKERRREIVGLIRELGEEREAKQSAR